MTEYDDGRVLECPVCLEPYDRMHHLPKMMSCLHTTCIVCIAAMLGVPKVPSNYDASAPTYEASGNRLPELQAVYRSGGGNRPFSLAPPPLPQRQNPSSHPTLHHTKPAVVKKPYEIPKNTTFRCPLCRTSVNSDSVQTNRYIIAHLCDLRRLEGSKASNVGGVTSGAPGDNATTSQQQQQQPQQQNPRVPLLENWCNSCCHPAMVGCQDHDKIPLAEWTAQKVQTLLERTSLMQVRLRQHEDSLSTSEKEVRDVLSALNAVISKVEIQRRDGRRLLGTLKALQNDWSRAEGEAATSEGRVDQLRKKAISLKEQTKLLHDLKNQASRLESGGHDNVVMWQSSKKLYVKKDSLIFSITKECEDYIA